MHNHIAEPKSRVTMRLAYFHLLALDLGKETTACELRTDLVDLIESRSRQNRIA